MTLCLLEKSRPRTHQSLSSLKFSISHSHPVQLCPCEIKIIKGLLPYSELNRLFINFECGDVIIEHGGNVLLWERILAITKIN